MPAGLGIRLIKVYFASHDQGKEVVYTASLFDSY